MEETLTAVTCEQLYADLLANQVLDSVLPDGASAIRVVLAVGSTKLGVRVTYMFHGDSRLIEDEAKADMTPELSIFFATWLGRSLLPTLVEIVLEPGQDVVIRTQSLLAVSSDIINAFADKQWKKSNDKDD